MRCRAPTTSRRSVPASSKLRLPAIRSGSRAAARAGRSALRPQSAMRLSMLYGTLASAISRFRSLRKRYGAHYKPREDRHDIRKQQTEKGFIPVTGTTHDIGSKIANELASCEVKLIASLPDNWLMDVIDTVKRDDRFIHIPVNREESAVGMCSGAYMGAMGSAALMGASGFMTVIYAITKINYTYEIPLFVMGTLRGAAGDHHKHHISNGLYLLRVMDAINMPYVIIDKPDEIPLISRSYHHTRTVSRPMAVLFTRDLLRGSRP